MSRVPRDLTANAVFGIDLAHSGLLCRFGLCRQRFLPAHSNSTEDLAVAAAKRDTHEIREHGYHHVVTPSPLLWSFADQFSHRGRSSIGSAAYHRRRRAESG